MRLHSVHWRAPATMIAAFLIGGLLAIGHHLFYRHLNGTIVPTSDLRTGNLSYPRQQLNVQIGTAFAFLVKAFMAIATSIAYIQIFWHGFVHSTKSKPPTVTKVNDALAARGNLLSLLSPGPWLWNPILLILAVVMWMMPITSILTPGTLSVRAVLATQSSEIPVPFINFTTLRFSDRLIDNTYNGPSQIMLSIAAAVSARGAILPIIPPFTNSSWQTIFNGPVLRCTDLDRASVKNVSENFSHWLKSLGGSWVCGDLGRAIYLSWFHDGPFTETMHENGTLADIAPTTKGLNEGEDAVFHIAAYPGMVRLNNACQDFPSMLEGIIGGDGTSIYDNSELSRADQDPLGTVGDGANVVQCQLYKSRYKVQFDYVNGEQRVDIDARAADSDTKLKTISKIRVPECSPSGSDSRKCNFDTSQLPDLAYQSMLDAFANLLNGTIAVPYIGPLRKSSSILSTTLVQSNELAYLDDRSTNYLLGFDNAGDLEGWFARNNISIGGGPNNGQYQPGLDTHKPIFGNMSLGRPLGHMLEEMFRNYTVSLMSTPLLQHNPNAAEAPRANVTTTTTRNIYFYTAFRLWIAYGTAVGFTAVAVIYGLVLMVSTNASYSDNFSTIMRSAWIADVDDSRKVEETGCRDPLPKALADAKIRWVEGHRERDGSVEYEEVSEAED